ncbi:hypothetical protein K457DRAFT_116537 [Linnemannia elongata AG-77]|uniref:Actin-like ATPase domain-containing protein n=1 Tax=Linnemannia elongata AG-77 TaxID=1314771 RepID=A0A197JLV1_9FUNG|nr:hypothetical protein K457DRAFT_116537 [Linnemannia elongata AG-77]
MQQQSDYRPQEYYPPQQIQQQLRLQQQNQPQPGRFEASWYDADGNYYSYHSYPAGAAPYPAVSSGMPLGQGQSYGQGQRFGQDQGGGYFSGQAPNPVYITNGNETSAYHPNKFTHNDNNGLPPAREHVSPLQSSPGSLEVQILLSSAKYRELKYYPVIVAIDFGMKYTKVAYASMKNGYDKEISHITNWPHHSFQTERTPSLITYNKHSKQMEDWGYKAQEDMKKSSAKDYCLLTNLKVHLDQRYDVQPLANGISVHQALSDYFRKLKEYIVTIIAKDFHASRGGWDDYSQYCLAVPGHWSDEAKQAMRSIAMEAGLGLPTDPPYRLLSISEEEEAMAIYCVRETDQLDLRHGDRFMICYAPEGESVTLVMFEVSASTHDGWVRQLKEVARSFGPSCGSDFVDANMERLLERRLRKYRDIISADHWEDIMYHFAEEIRRYFDGQKDQLMLLPATLLAQRGIEVDNEEAGIDNGYMVFEAANMKDEVFEPVVKDVLTLIGTLLELAGKSCKALFLLGEFGSSEYVQRRVREEFENKAGMISCPPRWDLAISRGAVYAVLDSK